MLILAVLVLILSTIALVLTLRDLKAYSLKQLAYGIISMLFWILGSVWYILSLSILPYMFVMGVALGSAVICFLSVFPMVLRKQLSFFNIFNITSVLSFMFFTLVFILRVFPNLLGFLPF